MKCCVTGHRSKGFPFVRNEDNPINMKYEEMLRDSIKRLVHQGYFDFISGMAEGADMDFAKAVLYAKKVLNYDFITLEAALPCPFYMPKNPTEFHNERDRILKMCDKVTVVSPQYYRGCMQKRNRYMVNNTDMVLAIWNGEHSGGTWDTLKYAKECNKPIQYIMLKKMGLFESLH